VIVTGALCAWNERPEDLDACVRGLGQIADRVVFLDGAYVRYPGATPHSPKEQIAAIREAAAAVNIECRIVQPDFLWAGQVAKRSALLAIASADSDWIATVDADHVITADREIIRNFLSQHRGDVINVPYVTPLNPRRPLDRSAVGQWHVEQAVERVFIPHLWRALPGMRVEKRHWWYAAVKDGHSVWLWGGDGSMRLIEGQDMNRDYEIEHRTLFRTEAQIKASRAFLNDRIEIVEKTGQEDDRPDLPRPTYSYDFVMA
jgi:hypothetical protein